MDIMEKIARNTPFNLFYSVIDDGDTASQPYSITFQDLFDPKLGKIESSLQLNYLVDMDWLLDQYTISGNGSKPLVLIHGDKEFITPDAVPDTVQIKYMALWFPDGTLRYPKHHSKLIINCYEDGSLRVFLPTGNLRPQDWEQNSVQGVWISASCPELPQDQPETAGESPTGFKGRLLTYLRSYEYDQLAYFIERVKKCDFLNVNVFLITSTWNNGDQRPADLMASDLRAHCPIDPEENSKWPIIAQVSSVAVPEEGQELERNLVSQAYRNWLERSLIPNLSAVSTNNVENPTLKMIYSTWSDINNYNGPGPVPSTQDLTQSDPWIEMFLHEWNAISTNRNRSLPRLCTFMRASPDYKKAAYFLLTSANISRAAWGGNPQVHNYELGVLLLPKFLTGVTLFSLEGENRLVVPYDVPPRRVVG